MMYARHICFILTIFTLSACGNNPYQVYELKEATEQISRGELSPDFKYPKNTLYIDTLRIRIAPCKKKGKCSEELASELHISTVTYFDSTLPYAKAIFSVISPGNAKLEDNYMNLYNSVKELVASNGMTLKLTSQQMETLEKAYADWQQSQ